MPSPTIAAWLMLCAQLADPLGFLVWQNFPAASSTASSRAHGPSHSLANAGLAEPVFIGMDRQLAWIGNMSVPPPSMSSARLPTKNRCPVHDAVVTEQAFVDGKIWRVCCTWAFSHFSGPRQDRANPFMSAPLTRVFGLVRNRVLDSPESVYPVCMPCPIAQARAARPSVLLPFPLAHKRSARDSPDTQT